MPTAWWSPTPCASYEFLKTIWDARDGSPVLLPQYQHWAVGVADDALGYGADEQAADAGTAVRIEHDQVGMRVAGIARNGVARVAEQHVEQHLAVAVVGEFLAHRLEGMIA